jgi:hypothetical protein
MKSKDFQKEITEKYEEDVYSYLELKLEMLEAERKIKETADFTPLEPQYAYESSDEWKEYMRKVAMHNIIQNELAIAKQKKDLELKKLEREEIEELSSSQEGN